MRACEQVIAHILRRLTHPFVDLHLNFYQRMEREERVALTLWYISRGNSIEWDRPLYNHGPSPLLNNNVANINQSPYQRCHALLHRLVVEILDESIKTKLSNQEQKMLYRDLKLQWQHFTTMSSKNLQTWTCPLLLEYLILIRFDRSFSDISISRKAFLLEFASSRSSNSILSSITYSRTCLIHSLASHTVIVKSWAIFKWNSCSFFQPVIHLNQYPIWSQLELKVEYRPKEIQRWGCMAPFTPRAIKLDIAWKQTLCYRQETMITFT